MERIIFILSYEKRWDCWMVYANRAIDAGDFFQSIGRYIGDEDLEVWPVVRKITETIRKYDTPMLWKKSPASIARLAYTIQQSQRFSYDKIKIIRSIA